MIIGIVDDSHATLRLWWCLWLWLIYNDEYINEACIWMIYEWIIMICMKQTAMLTVYKFYRWDDDVAD